MPDAGTTPCRRIWLCARTAPEASANGGRVWTFAGGVRTVQRIVLTALTATTNTASLAGGNVTSEPQRARSKNGAREDHEEGATWLKMTLST